LQSQNGELARFELEYKVGRELAPVAIYLLVEALYRYSIDLGRGHIEDDFLPPQNRDSGFNRNHGRLSLFCQGVRYREWFCRAQSHPVIVVTIDSAGCDDRKTKM
jgi:hypothetical protein